jgi:hypothetical protein
MRKEAVQNIELGMRKLFVDDKSFKKNYYFICFVISLFKSNIFKWVYVRRINIFFWQDVCSNNIQT